MLGLRGQAGCDEAGQHERVIEPAGGADKTSPWRAVSRFAIRASRKVSVAAATTQVDQCSSRAISDEWKQVPHDTATPQCMPRKG